VGGKAPGWPSQFADQHRDFGRIGSEMNMQVLRLFAARPQGHLTRLEQINQMNGEGTFCPQTDLQRQRDRTTEADRVGCQNAHE